MFLGISTSLPIVLAQQPVMNGHLVVPCTAATWVSHGGRHRSLRDQSFGVHPGRADGGRRMVALLLDYVQIYRTDHTTLRPGLIWL